MESFIACATEPSLCKYDDAWMSAQMGHEVYYRVRQN